MYICSENSSFIWNKEYQKSHYFVIMEKTGNIIKERRKRKMMKKLKLLKLSKSRFYKHIFGIKSVPLRKVI